MIKIATTFSNRYSRIDGLSLHTTVLEYKLEEEHIVPGAEAGFQLEGGRPWLFSIRGCQQSFFP
jgi:hypothetical protein